jgi:predicted Fe-S protein YdhL (DUF1289 family)
VSLNQKALSFVAASAKGIKASDPNGVKAVPSPCMSVCQMDEALGVCQGCLRTLDEIGRWGQADDAYKRQVWARIEERISRYAV